MKRITSISFFLLVLANHHLDACNFLKVEINGEVSVAEVPDPWEPSIER